MTKTGMPRWLEIQAEIDYWLWILGNIAKEDKSLSGIAREIDEATGSQKSCLK